MHTNLVSEVENMKWIHRIKNAIKRKKFTELDKDLADDFRTCAIGERGIREDFMSPKAEDLGMEFFRNINDNKPKQAMKTYRLIQKLEVPKYEST